MRAYAHTRAGVKRRAWAQAREGARGQSSRTAVTLTSGSARRGAVARRRAGTRSDDPRPLPEKIWRTRPADLLSVVGPRTAQGKNQTAWGTSFDAK